MKIELSVSGNNLATAHSFASAKLEDDTELGKTEVVEGTTKPCWTKSFLFDYDPEQDRSVTIEIHDSKKANRTKGSGTFKVNELLEAKGKVLMQQSSAGLIIVHAAEHSVTGTLLLQLRGAKLKNVDGFFRKSDPFFVLERGGEEIHRSETVMDDLEPVWNITEIELSQIFGDDDINLDTPLKLSVFDQDENDAHDFMGSFETSINKLLSSKRDDANNLKIDKKIAGQIHVLKAQLVGFEDVKKEAKTAMEIVSKVETLKTTVKTKENSARKLAVEAEAAQKAAAIAAEEAEAAKASLEEALAALESL